MIAFAFIVRNVDDLIRRPPVATLRFASARETTNAVQALLIDSGLRFVIVDTPRFAYEPVLKRLKEMKEIPLEDKLLMLDQPGRPELYRFQPTDVILDLVALFRERATESLDITIADKQYTLDMAQANALTYALESPLSVIQGPPGMCSFKGLPFLSVATLDE